MVQPSSCKQQLLIIQFSASGNRTVADWNPSDGLFRRPARKILFSQMDAIMGQLVAHRRARFWAASTAPGRQGFSGPPNFRHWWFSNWPVYQHRRWGKKTRSTKPGGSKSMLLTTSLDVDSEWYGYYPELRERSEYLVFYSAQQLPNITDH
jgi:hypothetical protein